MPLTWYVHLSKTETNYAACVFFLFHPCAVDDADGDSGEFYADSPL